MFFKLQIMIHLKIIIWIQGDIGNVKNNDIEYIEISVLSIIKVRIVSETLC